VRTVLKLEFRYLESVELVLQFLLLVQQLLQLRDYSSTYLVCQNYIGVV